MGFDSYRHQLMSEPLRSCPVRDPFGAAILITCPLPEQRNER
jgi:hypothetical protein